MLSIDPLKHPKIHARYNIIAKYIILLLDIFSQKKKQQKSYHMFIFQLIEMNIWGRIQGEGYSHFHSMLVMLVTGGF